VRFIHGYAKSSVRSVQFPFGAYIALGLTGKNYQRIDGVIVHRVDIPIFGVNMNTALELDLGFQSADGALGLGDAGGRGIVLPIVDQNIE
jgi:hypothetical protein